MDDISVGKRPNGFKRMSMPAYNLFEIAESDHVIREEEIYAMKVVRNGLIYLAISILLLFFEHRHLKNQPW